MLRAVHEGVQRPGRERVRAQLLGGAGIPVHLSGGGGLGEGGVQGDGGIGRELHLEGGHPVREDAQPRDEPTLAGLLVTLLRQFWIDLNEELGDLPLRLGDRPLGHVGEDPVLHLPREGIGRPAQGLRDGQSLPEVEVTAREQLPDPAEPSEQIPARRDPTARGGCRHAERHPDLLWGGVHVTVLILEPKPRMGRQAGGVQHHGRMRTVRKPRRSIHRVRIHLRPDRKATGLLRECVDARHSLLRPREALDGLTVEALTHGTAAPREIDDACGDVPVRARREGLALERLQLPPPLRLLCGTRVARLPPRHRLVRGILIAEPGPEGLLHRCHDTSPSGPTDKNVPSTAPNRAKHKCDPHHIQSLVAPTGAVGRSAGPPT